jgi:NDP-sugar pyrophosphorylase family protein
MTDRCPAEAGAADLAAWPALVLTAGFGTRLRPLSEVRAKPAVPVAGTPLIVRVLDWLRRSGIRRVVLNLHHRPASITRLIGDGTALGLEVRYSWETRVLGSAGGVRRALALLESPRFLIVNGDTLTDCCVPSLIAQHAGSGALVTLAVVEGDVARYGGVLADASGTVRGFGRSAPGLTAWHFIGVQAAEATAFAALDPNVPSETIKAVYPQLMAERPGAIRVWPSPAEFFDVGTPRDYLATVASLAAREGRGWDVGIGCRIAPDARIDSSILWDRVSIGAGAVLTECVVADDVEIPAGARYHKAAIVRRGAGLEVAPI